MALDDFDFTQEEDLSLPLIPTGDYESIISKAEEGELASGTRVINLTFKVRDDVEQGCKGREVYDTIWPDREDPNKWDRQKIYAIIHNGQDLNNKNTRTKFNGLDDLIQYLNGLAMRISVNTYTRKDGTSANGIKRNGYAPSKAKPKTIGAPVVEKNDDNLPF